MLNTTHPSWQTTAYGWVFCWAKEGSEVSTYTRPHLTYERQLESLKARGLEVPDDDAALSYLRRLGYYRLSAYWYPFRKSTIVTVDGKFSRKVEDDFHEGASFQSAVELYVFDKRLRMLALDAIERIEVALRVDIAYGLGRRRRPPALSSGLV
ncbi:Abi family protein [Xanthomonas campestris]|uniref:Abi family protein n=1 Tax=Xanthomonas campestris TaxID=339 RepID=UPI001CBE8DA9